MKIFWFIFIAFFVYPRIVSGRTVSSPGELVQEPCDSTATVTTNVYFGWPHKISCDLFLSNGEESLYDLYDNVDNFDLDTNIQCLVANDEGRILLNATTVFDNLSFSSPGLYIPEVNKQTTISYIMLLRVSGTKICLKKRVYLNATAFKEQTCEEFLQSQQKFMILSPVGNPKQLVCSNADLRPAIYATASNSNASFKWQKNCSKQLPAGIKSNGNNLEFSPMSYDHAGTYMCSVTHNGMTRYVKSYDACVQKPLIPNGILPRITCSQSVYRSTIRNNVSIECEINFGKGHIPRSNFVLFAGTSKVHHRCTLNEQNLTNRQILCHYNLNENECFMRIPTLAQRKPSPFIVPLQLTIRNVYPEDFQRYFIVAETISGDRSMIGVQLKEIMSTI